MNPGLVFSSFGPAVAIIASAAAFAVLAILALRMRARFDQPLTAIALWAFLLIALGGASNIFDRIAGNGVIDYIIFVRSAWNIADIMILAGLALMLRRVPTGAKTDRSIKIDSGNTPHN
jgi:lipoprotein signal peptidase